MIRFALLAVLVMAARASAATPAEYRDVALKAAREHVPKVLKNPRSAEFDEGSIKCVPLVEWGSPVWVRVSGVVRGTNAFNAVVPSQWSAYLTEVDGKPTLGLLMLKDTLVHAGPDAKTVLEHMERVAIEQKEISEAKLAALRAKTDEALAARKAELVKQADAIRDDLAKKRQAQSDAEALLRIEKLRRRGRQDGFAAVNAMGRAKSRLTDAEATKRAKRDAMKANIPAADVDDYVSGWVSGAASAKAGQPLTD